MKINKLRPLTNEEILLVSGGFNWNKANEEGFKGAIAGAAGGAAMGAMSGTMAGGIGAGPGAVAGASIGGIGGGVAGFILGGWESDKEKKEREKNDKNNSRVICTHFYQKGMLSRELWRADMEYTLQHLPQSMVNGYHLWAIPYVRLMRKSPLAEKLMYPIAYHRAREIAYQMGYLENGSIRGKIFRAILEPVCAFLGMFTTERKYQELWRNA